MMSLSISPNGPAPDYGEPCPCGYDPPGRMPVHTALNILPSAHHEDDELTLAVPKLSKVWVNRQSERQRDATVRSRLSSSQAAPVGLARPAKQGRQAHCPRATAEPLWPAEQAGPWETASVSQQDIDDLAECCNCVHSNPWHLSLHTTGM